MEKDEKKYFTNRKWRENENPGTAIAIVFLILIGLAVGSFLLFI